MGFEYAHLSSGEKRALCRDLLQEFGCRNITERGDELIHSCALPHGLHRNGDAHPSASLNWDKLTFRCLGCGAKGGLLWFIAEMRGTDTAKVRQWLGTKTGLGGVQDIETLMQWLDNLYAVPDEATYVMPRYDRRVLDPWMFVHPWLTDPVSEGGRGIPVANVERHLVGYGVLSVRVGDDSFVPSHRVVIPHFWKGELVGWQSRRIFNDGTPKYVSTPEIPRDRTLFNYNPKAPAMIVESPMSVVARSHQRHLEATFGAAVTLTQLRLIEQHPEVVLFFDNDQAGWKATRDVGEYLMTRTSNVRVVANPYNADPADFTDDVFSEVCQNTVPFVLWTPPTSLEPWDRAAHEHTLTAAQVSD